MTAHTMCNGITRWHRLRKRSIRKDDLHKLTIQNCFFTSTVKCPGVTMWSQQRERTGQSVISENESAPSVSGKGFNNRHRLNKGLFLFVPHIRFSALLYCVCCLSYCFHYHLLNLWAYFFYSFQRQGWFPSSSFRFPHLFSTFSVGLVFRCFCCLLLSLLASAHSYFSSFLFYR